MFEGLAELVKDMSEIANLFRDMRGDMKKLIETLSTLNNHMSKLEKFTGSVEKLTKALEEANKNIELFNEIIKGLK